MSLSTEDTLVLDVFLCLDRDGSSPPAHLFRSGWSWPELNRDPSSDSLKMGDLSVAEQAAARRREGWTWHDSV